jgi:nitroreductase
MIRRLTQILKTGSSLLSDKHFAWSVQIVKNRLRYKFDALYFGISMNQASKANLHNFRRNIHRLEKGLSYQTIKDVFAEDYILETINYLKEAKTKNTFDQNTVAWGEAVLELYFKTCKHTERIATAYQQYQNLNVNNCYPGWVPYSEHKRPKLEITYDSLYQLALRRRSVRFYLDKKIEPHIIQQAIQIASQSPSACNRQSFKFLFFNDKPFVDKLAALPGGVVGYELPSIVVVIGSYRGYFDVRDINAPIIDSSLATMAFLFGLETLELSSVCINWPNLPDREEKIRQLIHLEKDEFVVMMVGVGYPDANGKIPYSAKKALSDLLLINERIIKEYAR